MTAFPPPATRVAAVVRRIFTDYAAGMTILEIAKALNAEGVPVCTASSGEVAS